MRRDITRNIAKIFYCLKEAGSWLWIREIARRTRLHHKTVSRLLDGHLNVCIDRQDLPGLKLSMVRLRPDAQLDKILKFIKIKRQIERR